MVILVSELYFFYIELHCWIVGVFRWILNIFSFGKIINLSDCGAIKRILLDHFRYHFSKLLIFCYSFDFFLRLAFKFSYLRSILLLTRRCCSFLSRDELISDGSEIKNQGLSSFERQHIWLSQSFIVEARVHRFLKIIHKDMLISVLAFVRKKWLEMPNFDSIPMDKHPLR